MRFNFGALKIIHFWPHSFVKGLNKICAKFDNFEWTKVNKIKTRGILCSKKPFCLAAIYIEEILNTNLQTVLNIVLNLARKYCLLQPYTKCHRNKQKLNKKWSSFDQICPLLAMNNFGLVPFEEFKLKFNILILHF